MIGALWLLLALGAPASDTTCRKVVVEYQDEMTISQTRRTIWRSGDRKARIEERELLIIIDHPDAWRVDLGTRRGEHYDTRGDQADSVKVLMFEAPALKDLEFGRELEFFERHGRKEEARAGEDRYVATLNGATVTGYFSAGTDRALSVRNDVTRRGYRYREHTTVPCSASMFEKPEGIRFRKAKKR